MVSPTHGHVRVIHDLQWWGKWVIANASGELLGLGTVAVVGFWLTLSAGEATSRLAVLGVAVHMMLLGA